MADFLTRREGLNTKIPLGKSTWGHGEKTATYRPRREVSEGTSSSNTLILDFSFQIETCFCCLSLPVYAALLHSPSRLMHKHNVDDMWGLRWKGSHVGLGDIRPSGNVLLICSLERASKRSLLKNVILLDALRAVSFLSLISASPDVLEYQVYPVWSWTRTYMKAACKGPEKVCVGILDDRARGHYPLGSLERNRIMKWHCLNWYSSSCVNLITHKDNTLL